MSGERDGLDVAVTAERHRELAIEHLLFGTIRFVGARHPELLDALDESVAHLGDSAHGPAKDDEAVREIARRFLASLRRG